MANNIQSHKAYKMRVAASREIHTRTTHAQSDIDDASGEDSETGDEREKNGTMQQYAQPARFQHLAVSLCSMIQQLCLRFGLSLLLGPALLLDTHAFILAKPYT